MSKDLEIFKKFGVSNAFLHNLAMLLDPCCSGMQQGGGGVAPASGSVQVIRITKQHFDDATNYTNSFLAGKKLAIFVNEYPRYLEPDEWERTPGGIRITLPGFDSSFLERSIFITVNIQE